MNTTKTLARVNNQNIVLIENGTKKVPIRPICDALGISYQGQIDKIKEDDILKSTLSLSLTVGSDGKEREMQCIPFKFVFGWLFTINPKNVKPEAQEAVQKYRLECYNALYTHFTASMEFLQEKQSLLEAKLIELEGIKTEFSSAKTKLKDCNEELSNIRNLTFEQWQFDKGQLLIPFTEEATPIS